jgi:hypothetical protein
MKIRFLRTSSLIVSFIFVLLLLGGCDATPWSGGSLEQSERPEMTVYFSNSCTCCKRYIQYLRDHGFSVEERLRTNRGLQSVKSKHGIRQSEQSCHTGVIGDYVVEGHVPVQAIDQLLKEEPEVAGITVPGMPRHSPGMGPRNGEPLAIYSVSSDQSESTLFAEVTY